MEGDEQEVRVSRAAGNNAHVVMSSNFGFIGLVEGLRNGPLPVRGQRQFGPFAVRFHSMFCVQ